MIAGFILQSEPAKILNSQNMLKYPLLLITVLCAALFMLAQGCFEPSSVKAVDSIIPLPPHGCLYHGVHPMPLSSRDEDLQPEISYHMKRPPAKPAAWVDISQHWGISRKFPSADRNMDYGLRQHSLISASCSGVQKKNFSRTPSSPLMQY